MTHKTNSPAAIVSSNLATRMIAMGYRGAREEATMPYSAPKYCPVPGYPPYAGGKGCPICRRERDAQRGPSSQRGYDKAWRELRASFLQRHPTCAICGDAATEVDHVVNLRDRGARLDDRNLQSLCRKHHQQKTLREGVNAPFIG